jgi:hypothetical protein
VNDGTSWKAPPNIHIQIQFKHDIMTTARCGKSDGIRRTPAPAHDGDSFLDRLHQLNVNKPVAERRYETRNHAAVDSLDPDAIE